MSFAIKSGGGNKVEALVNNDQQLAVFSVNKSFAAFRSESGNAFGCPAQHVVAVTGVEEVVGMFVNNNTAKDVIISMIGVSGTGAQMVFRFYFDVTRTSGGDVIAPINMNRKSANPSGVVGYSNFTTPLVMGYSAAKQFAGAITTAAGSPQDATQFDNVIILGPGNSWGATVTGTVGDFCGIACMFAEVPV